MSEVLHPPMNTDTILCDQANLANGWLTQHQSLLEGKCRKCQVVAERIKGSISKATTTYTPFLITTPAGEAMWKVTRLCEPCSIEVFASHEVVVALSPAKRLTLVYRDPAQDQWVLVRQSDGKMPDMAPLDENIMVIRK